jgi:glycine/D-amino acid oxidase-like deaminating enzyme
MLATEPLPPEAWRAIGWNGCAPVADQRYQFAYAQRTPDGRIALGGRGLTYRLGGPIRESDEVQARIHDRLEETLRRLFPAAAAVPVSHRWGCFFAAPRDWSMGVSFDQVTGLGQAGGYSGHGVVASSLAGRTLADLITGTESELTGLPWVGHVSRRWEPEPLRFLGARTIAAVAASADAVEDRTGRPARRIGIVQRWMPGR